ncbi:MAG: hypothetical protein RJA22_2522 [Verrucomicrobiota bacterium]
MTPRTLLVRSLRHHWRGHLGVFLGAAVGSAALIGALVVGDSVRGSLRDQALQRLGPAESALAPHDRFFTQDLAGRLAEGSDARLWALLRLPGTAARQDRTARANHVQVLGLPERVDRGKVWLNDALAAQLNAKPGDDLVLRVHKPTALSRDVPITPQSDASVALRLQVEGILPAGDLGNFSLQAGGAPPLNAFVNHAQLAAAAGLAGKANVILAAAPPGSAGTGLDLAARLRKAVTPADLGLELRVLQRDGAAEVELISPRIFLDPPAVAALGQQAAPARPVLTYLVNQIAAGTHRTPYSMVCAAGAPWTPPDLRDDEIVVNQWLADDLRVKAGDTVDLAYFLAESGARLVERTNRFRIRAVVPLAGVHADRSLMPEFPGLAKAESTHEWDAGFPLVHKIRDQDEQYWKDHRGTPKAFVSLAAGQALWGNRFGNLTAVRFPVPAGTDPAAFRDTTARELVARIDPAVLDLRFAPVRAQALAGAAQAQDFGGLFLGFSFFLIVAALILMSLLFQFGLEQRMAETGTLLALGFTPRRVRGLLLREGVAVAFLGGVLGVAGGLLYAQGMVLLLTTLWRDAVGGNPLAFHVTGPTLAIGLVAAVAVSAVTIAVVLRRQARRPARELLAGGAGLEPAPTGAGRGGTARWVAAGAGAAALGLIGWALSRRDGASPELFFGAGALLLVAGLAGVALLLTQLERREAGRRLTLAGLGLRGCARRRQRSLASAALLACGSFLVVAVGANRLDADRDAGRRGSGTGGFTWWGESALPIVRDLNTAEGREFYGLDDALLPGVAVVPFRVREGDEASCLNLNRAQQPRLLGVNPALLAARGAFTFARVEQGRAADAGWALLLATNGAPDEIPAIGDAASIQWALGRKLGDTIDYVDERGRPFKVRLVAGVANSILQGNLIIDEAAFLRRFPGEAGHRIFLIDTPSNMAAAGREKAAAELSRALQDAGLELTPATRRLDAFNAVQNTYLNTFQVLGGLGLLLGSAGLGVVVLRNALERRSEFGLLQAVGFRRPSLRRLVLSEHAGLLGLGLAVGVLSALAAVLPVLLAPGARVHALALGATLAGVLFSGLLWTWLAARLAMRGRLLQALRPE